MSTDRELLELAAKAAGIAGDCHHCGIYVSPERTPDNDSYWNPLEKDGDALRLAVKLRIDVYLDGRVVEAVPYAAPCVDEALDGALGPDAATRRAIVRAAAEIGRGMP